MKILDKKKISNFINNFLYFLILTVPILLIIFSLFGVFDEGFWGSFFEILIIGSVISFLLSFFINLDWKPVVCSVNKYKKVIISIIVIILIIIFFSYKEHKSEYALKEYNIIIEESNKNISKIESMSKEYSECFNFELKNNFDYCLENIKFLRETQQDDVLLIEKLKKFIIDHGNDLDSKNKNIAENSLKILESKEYSNAQKAIDNMLGLYIEVYTLLKNSNLYTQDELEPELNELSEKLDTSINNAKVYREFLIDYLKSNYEEDFLKNYYKFGNVDLSKINEK